MIVMCSDASEISDFSIAAIIACAMELRTTSARLTAVLTPARALGAKDVVAKVAQWGGGMANEII